MVVIALNFIPLPQRAEAAEYRLTPSIRLGQGWDSNIFGTYSNDVSDVSDFFTSVTPEFILSAATPNLAFQLSAGVEGRWYYNYPEVSSPGYTKYVRLRSIEGGWRPTARFSVSPEVYYLETLDPAARAALLPVGPTLPTPGIATYGLQKTRDFGASIGLRYQVSSSVEANGTVYGAAHQSPDEPGRVSDSRAIGADASVRYAFAQTSSAGVYVNGSDEKFINTPDSDSRILGVGLLGEHQFSTSFRIEGRLGMEFLRQSASSPGTPDQNVNDPAGRIALGYSDNTFRASLYGDFGYSGLSGANQVTRQGTIGASLADNVTQQWSWNLGVNYQTQFDAYSVSSIVISRTANGTGSIRYTPWEWGTFALTGNAYREKDYIPVGTLNRYSVLLGFTLGKTYTAD
jgi:hypothetical protein